MHLAALSLQLAEAGVEAAQGHPLEHLGLQVGVVRLGLLGLVVRVRWTQWNKRSEPGGGGGETADETGATGAGTAGAAEVTAVAVELLEVGMRVACVVDVYGWPVTPSNPLTCWS